MSSSSAPLNIIGMSIVCYEISRSFNVVAHGLTEQTPHWDDLTQETRLAHITTMQAIVSEPNKSVKDEWDEWYNDLIADGVDGEIYNEEKKVMYGLLSYDEMMSSESDKMTIVAHQIIRDVARYLIDLRYARPTHTTFFAELSDSEKVLEIARLLSIVTRSFVSIIYGPEHAERINHQEYSDEFYADYIEPTKSMIAMSMDELADMEVATTILPFSTTEISPAFLASISITIAMLMVKK